MTQHSFSHPGGSLVKNLSANAEDAGDVGSSPGSERFPREGNGNWIQYSCQEEPHGQRSLAGYSPGGRKRIECDLIAKQPH